MIVSYRGREIRTTTISAATVLALVVDARTEPELLLESFAGPSEAGAVEAGRRWIDKAAVLGPGSPLPSYALAGATFGQWVAFGAGGIAIADNTDRDLYAGGWVAATDGATVWIRTSAGQLVTWIGHGIGPAGQRAWLGTSGSTLTAPPGGSARVEQVVLRVVDSDTVQLFPPPHIPI